MTAPFGYRSPDGDIDLERALGPHLGHYVGTMVAGATGSRTQVLALGGAETEAGLLVRRAYGQPTRASSCGTVAVQPSFVWDACAYYLRLGVHWTASKKELRLAYLALSPDDGDEQLHYCLMQLLDDRVRFAYDRVPLGGIFTWDRDVAAALRRVAAQEAARRVAEDGAEFSTDEVMEEMGFGPQPPEEDGDPEQPPGAPARPADVVSSRWEMQWGHYVLAGPGSFPRADAALLEAWQGMVAAALRERGIVMEFAVAQGPEDSPMVLRDVKEDCIFVVTDKGASPQMAQRAVEMGISLGMVADNNMEGV
jgi:hypothetical protein